MTKTTVPAAANADTAIHPVDMPDSTGRWIKRLIYGALGYFILPTDILPDVLPILGFTDDLGLLAAVFMAASQYMDEDVNARAEAKVIEWLGREEKEV